LEQDISALQSPRIAFFLGSNDLGRAWGHHVVISLATELNKLGFDSCVFGYYGLAVFGMKRVGYSSVLGKISTAARYLAESICMKSASARLSYSNLAKLLLKREIDIVFTTWPYPGLARAAQRSGSRFVVWDLDSPSTLCDEAWLDAFQSADLILTYSKGTVKILRQLGYGNVHWFPAFHDPAFFFPMDKVQKSNELVFVGDYFWQLRKTRGLQSIIEPLARKYREKLVIYGRGWPRVPYADCTVGEAIEWRQLNFLYNTSRICLNIHRDDQIRSELCLNPRTFDIMGAGGFMLCDYVEGTEDIFQIGGDFVVSKNEKDTLDLVERYLGNEEERNKIARSGHARVMRGHGVPTRGKQLVELLKGLA